MTEFDYTLARAATALREWFLLNRCAYCASKPFDSVACLMRNCAIRELYWVADEVAAAVLEAAKAGGHDA